MTSTIPLEIVNIEEGGCHIFLNCEINNNLIADLILDTGASKTVFNEKMLEPYVNEITENECVESSGISDVKLQSKSGRLRMIKFGNLCLENESIILMDLDHINSLYKKIDNREIWGLLGGDFLLKYKVNINYQKKELIIRH